MKARMTLINKPSRQEDSTWEHQNNSLESPPSPCPWGNCCTYLQKISLIQILTHDFNNTFNYNSIGTCTIRGEITKEIKQFVSQESVISLVNIFWSTCS